MPCSGLDWEYERSGPPLSVRSQAGRGRSNRPLVPSPRQNGNSSVFTFASSYSFGGGGSGGTGKDLFESSGFGML